MELLKTWLLLACVAGTYAAPLSALGPTQCSRQTCNTENPRYEVGKRYTYHYTAASATWINGTSEQSSLNFDCVAQIEAISPCELTLTVRPNGDISATNEASLYDELEAHVLRFAFQDGIVTDVCPSREETTSALNFKRGFLSAIQAPVTEFPEEQTEIMTTETDVTGKCPVKLTLSPFPDSIMKYKDFKKCEHRSKLEGGIQATMLKAEAPLFSILECSQKCEVTFQSNIVSESVCEEHHVSKAFSTQNSGAMTNVRAAVELLNVETVRVPSSTVIERQTTILYDHEESQMETEHEILTKTKEILRSIDRRLSKRVGLEMPNLFSDLVTEMRKIKTLASMTDLKQFTQGESEALYKVFKDALPMCETTPSVEIVVTIINEVAASSDEAAKKEFNPTRVMWLTLPSMISHPTKEMISVMMPLIKTLTVEDSVFFLPISSLINRYCTSENPSCLEETEVRQAIEYFQELLGFDCTPTEQVPSLKMLMSLKALANARHLSTDSKIGTINNCFDRHNPDKGMEIRIAALELIRRLPCKPEYQTYAKAMYKNQHFDSELRIGAYRAIMTCPSEDIMEAIKEAMMNEQNQQVGSYVWTHLSNLNETRDPQKQHLKKWVQESDIMTTFSKMDLRKFSRNVELSWYNDETASGVTIDGDMIFSSKSFLPRELRLNNTVSLFGYAINLFEVGGRLEGMHQFLESFFGPRGYLKENSVKDLFAEYQQKQQESFLNNLPDAGEVTLPEGLPEGVTLDMYTQLLRLLQFQRKMFGGKLPLPLPGQPMPKGMPEGMTQEMYDDLLVYFMREGVPGERKKRHTIRESSINDIKSTYHANVEDHPHASVYFKMFGNELVYLDIAKIKTRLTEMKSSLNPMKILMDLAQEQTHELSKNAVLMDGSWTIPTAIGLPLKLAINGTVSMKIRTEGKIDMRGILIAPRSFEINGVVEPSAALEVSTSMEVTARQTRSGLSQVSRLHSSISLGGKIQVTDGKAFVLQVNVPDEKQEIIDVSSSIYLRLPDELIELPGIPERLEKSYCSGSVTTKYFGGQLCAEFAFPRSYASKDYPMFPLTGPAHMLVTLEKTDLFLTNWKLEGSYGLDKETINGVKVMTDRFHLMFGAPDSNTPRTFQVDVSYNRNDMEMNFAVITPIKTIDIYGKVVNNPMLRKLELSLTMDKTRVYTLDTEVESRPSVVDGDPVITFYPRLDITSPKGNVLKFRSSIGVREGQQTRISMQMSLDSPRTALVTVSGEVLKTESLRKVRYSTDLQISGRYVNVNVSAAWQKQKRDNIIGVDATVHRRVNGEIVKDIVITAKYTNRTTEDQNEWDLKTEFASARYPLLSFLFEMEYVGTSGSSESTSKFCYRYNGQECNQDSKVVMGHLLTWESTESHVIENLNFKIRNPANHVNMEIQQHVVHNTSHPVDFSFTILNNTSEMEVINAAIRTRTLSREPIKGDFEASLRSQTWRYAVLENWEFVKGGKAILNTAIHWDDQRATFEFNFTPTKDDNAELKRYDISSVLTYPLGSLTANWYALKRGYDVSSAVSASLSDQPLFAYQIDFINDTMYAPHLILDASFNITRPTSPISVVLHASRKGQNLDGGFNITLGTIKAFTSGLSYTFGTGEDMGLKIDSKIFVDVEIPEKDFSGSFLQTTTRTALKSEGEESLHYNGKQIFYRRILSTFSSDTETGAFNFTYDLTQNMSHPFFEVDYRAKFNITNGIHDHIFMVHRNKVPIVFLKVDYEKKKPETDKEGRKNTIQEGTNRHEVQIILRSPLVIMKDVRWNGTLDLTPTAFDFETRLLYFPDQERPFVMTINFQNKSNELVSHNELTTSFETTKRRISIFNMAKFDLGSGIVLGESSVEFEVHGTKPEKFVVDVEYTNTTEGDITSNKLVLTLNSPDNTIKTEGSLSYVQGRTYTTMFTIQVSEESIFGINSVIRNDSDSTQKSFDVDSTVNFFAYLYRIHTVHSQDDTSFHPNVKIYRADEQDPIAEADVSYSKVSQNGEIHTVHVTLNSEDIDPMTINTVYTNSTDTKNINIVISTSEDKHLDIVFNLATEFLPEQKTYDVVFQVDNTYLPGRKFEVATHVGIADNQINLNSDLKIAEQLVMNILYSMDDSSPSVTHIRKNAAFNINLPQMSEYPALATLGLLLNKEVQQDVMNMQKAEFRWGELTDDEAVVLQMTARSNQFEVLFSHPMDLPSLPKEMTFVLRNDTDPSSRQSFEIQVDGENRVNLMMLSGSYALINGNEKNRRAILTFIRPNHPDIQITLDAAVMNGDTIFSSNLQFKYSEDQSRLVEAMIEVVNNTNDDTMGYDVNLNLRHVVSDLDLGTALTYLNGKEEIYLDVKGLVGGTPGPFTFAVIWNREQKKYTVISQNALHDMVFTGQFEDRSYYDYKIYRVTMTNTYNGDRIVRSLFEFNSQSKEISYIVNYNPENADDFMRFRAGLQNETALFALVDSEMDGVQSVDARLLIALETPKILSSHLTWNPSWVQYVKEKALDVYDRMTEKYEERRSELRDSYGSLNDQFQMSYDDILESNSDIKVTFEDMRERFLVKYEAKREQIERMFEDFKTRSENYWNQLKEDWEPIRLNLEAKREEMRVKYRTWAEELKTVSEGYTETTSRRVEAFYNKNVKPIFEELKELFDILAEQHKVQLDILFPAIQPYDYLLPEPKDKTVPSYKVGNEEDVPDPSNDTIVETTILVSGKQTIVDTAKDNFYARFGRVVHLKIWTDLQRLWNETKAEFDIIFAEIESNFTQSNLYLDMMEQREKLMEQFPVEEWREQIVAKYEEIKESADMQDLIALVQPITEELIVSSNRTKAGLRNITDRVAKILKAYSLEIVEYLKTPIYELAIYDLESGEILLRVFLPFELHSLEEMPKSLLQWQVLRRFREMMEEVRERTKNTLGEITMSDGTTRSMYDLMFNEPMLLYKEGDIRSWVLGQRIKVMRKFWELVHLSKLYLNPINWIPPHQANAVIVGTNHYMTFDRTFYDFSSSCSYLLAHDFIDGNFTVIVEYNRDGAERTKSIVLYLNSTTAFEIKNDFTVMNGKQFLELPIKHGNTTIMRYLNAVRIHNTNGITITCDVAHDICRVNVSGWYFGKTAGLFGTYNYKSADDLTRADGEMARHLDDFTRSWKVGKHCSESTTDPLPECNSDPEEEANTLCAAHFLDATSSLTQCLGVVDPAPYYAMCSSKMCDLSSEQRLKEACKSIKAYVNECNRLDVGILMPDACVICDSLDGEFSQGQAKILNEPDVIPKSADVILVVEEKLCNEDVLDHIGEIIDMLDSELKNVREFSDNRFGLLGFGGEGIHDLPHIHTIDGKIFNEKRPLRFQGFPELEFAEDGSNDTFAAILAAANYPFRAGVAKKIILLSCSNCQRLYHPDKSYSDVSRALIRQGIQFYLLMDSQLELVPTRAKNTSPKNQVIYGIDNRTVFTNKALSSGSLIGDKSLRKLINEPINQCALLAYDSGGALFDSSKMGQKKFADVLTQRMVEHTVLQSCQQCFCKADDDGVGHAICEPCHIAERYPWLFDMERNIVEANYYGRLGMQSFVDYINTPAAESEPAQDTPVNQTPKKLP